MAISDWFGPATQWKSVNDQTVFAYGDAVRFDLTYAMGGMLPWGSGGPLSREELGQALYDQGLDLAQLSHDWLGYTTHIACFVQVDGVSAAEMRAAILGAVNVVNADRSWITRVSGLTVGPAQAPIGDRKSLPSGGAAGSGDDSGGVPVTTTISLAAVAVLGIVALVIWREVKSL